MSTLVIHPADASTDVLKPIYEGKDWQVINTPTRPHNIRDAIIDHDRIIMLGHGDPNGLHGYGGYVINYMYVPFLKEKQVAIVWCNSDKFVLKHDLRGFYTGMIISEVGEANYCLPKGIAFTPEDVTFSNLQFADAIKQAIDSPNMLSDVLDKYYHCADDNNIVKYNRERIYFR